MINMAKEKKPYPKALRRQMIRVRNRGKLCVCCPDIAVHNVVIGNNSNPEDNEQYDACQRHTSMAFDHLTNFYKHKHAREENLEYERKSLDTANHNPRY